MRNYDYPASRLEGTIASTAWTGRRVIGMTDCLSGLLDGMNDAGLAVSLTFGGRRASGPGFGVPLVDPLPPRDVRDDGRGARGPRARPRPRAAEHHRARPLGRMADRLRRAGPDAGVQPLPGDDEPPGPGRVAGVRARDPQRRARALPARPGRRPRPRPRRVRRRLPRGAPAQHGATRTASAPSTRRRTSRPRGASSTAGRASRGASRSRTSPPGPTPRPSSMGAARPDDGAVLEAVAAGRAEIEALHRGSRPRPDAARRRGRRPGGHAPRVLGPRPRPGRRAARRRGPAREPGGVAVQLGRSTARRASPPRGRGRARGGR